MPEAFAVLAVFTIAGIAYVAAWLQARDPARVDARQDFAQLKIQEAWLRERLERARQEQWSGEMIQPITDELAATLHRLARATEEKTGLAER